MIYFLQRADGDIKIGYTADNRVNKRIEELENQYGLLNQLGFLCGGMWLEGWLHYRFQDYRRPLRINSFTGNVTYTEFFEPVPKLTRFIRWYARPRYSADRTTHDRESA